ncbi:transporter substrate-binding domain-containing protein [Paenibacillus filicis]|uniref:Transporter substrate-binding domain-containing protein n=2 Tax=Paenibacillus filicis TaxID=669464 RepID=A0ABU9DNX9_9BACL
MLVFLVAVMMAVLAAGCGAKAVTDVTQASAPAGAGSPASAKEATPKKIKVGTNPVVPNVSFLNESGKLTGYDVELVREIDKRLPEYEFEFVTGDLANLFLSLDTKKIEFIAMHLEQNEERKAKYLFNKELYDSSKTMVAVNESNNIIQSIDDLKGKSVLVTPSTSTAAVIERYNKANQDAVKIVYGEITDAVTQIKSGRVDATIIDSSLAANLNRTADAKLKLVGPNLNQQSGIYFAFRKADGSPLSEAIDKVLKEMKDDGSLTKLIQQWLKRDYK